MDTHHTDDLAAAYSASVDREREAWQALHEHPPGTPGRARAWETWSQAIMHTNHAWRKLSASRVGRADSTRPANVHAQHARA